jgi:hypothetical protein
VRGFNKLPVFSVVDYSLTCVGAGPVSTFYGVSWEELGSSQRRVHLFFCGAAIGVLKAPGITWFCDCIALARSFLDVAYGCSLWWSSKFLKVVHALSFSLSTPRSVSCFLDVVICKLADRQAGAKLQIHLPLQPHFPLTISYLTFLLFLSI